MPIFCNETVFPTAYMHVSLLQESNGGVFNVDSDSSATFGNAVVFDDDSVATPYHGGAVYAGGLVRIFFLLAVPTKSEMKIPLSTRIPLLFLLRA